MRNKRKPNADASEGAPAWMNTYGDMVTLMLTFFVLLFSFSTINAKKWEALVQSFSGSTGVVANAGGAAGENVVDMDLPIIEPEQTHTKFDELYATITKHIGENGLETSLEVDKVSGTITIRMRDSALFDSGKDVIRADSAKLLMDLADIIVRYEGAIGMIRIEGHTDDIPINNARFESNWDLSVARAVRVLRYLLLHSKIPPEKLAAAGYGEFHPIADNDTPQGRAQNRRVSFLIESLE